jgi:hypothetical protein
VTGRPGTAYIDATAGVVGEMRRLDRVVGLRRRDAVGDGRRPPRRVYVVRIARKNVNTHKAAY